MNNDQEILADNAAPFTSIILLSAGRDGCVKKHIVDIAASNPSVLKESQLSVQSTKSVIIIKQEQCRITSIAISSETHTLFVVNHKNIITQFQKEDSSLNYYSVRTLKAQHTLRISSISLSNFKKLLLSAYYNGTLRVWDLQNGSQLACLNEVRKEHQSSILSCCWSDEDTLFASGDQDGGVVVWSPPLSIYNISNQFIPLCKFEATNNCSNIFGLKFQEYGLDLFAFYEKSLLIRLWGISEKELLDSKSTHLQNATLPLFQQPKRQSQTFYGQIYSFDVRGSMLVVGRFDKILSLSADSLISEAMKFEKVHNNQIRQLVFSKDGKFVASGSEDASVAIFDSNSGKCVKHIKNAHSNWVRAIVFPEGIGSFAEWLRLIIGVASGNNKRDLASCGKAGLFNNKNRWDINKWISMTDGWNENGRSPKREIQGTRLYLKKGMDNQDQTGKPSNSITQSSISNRTVEEKQDNIENFSNYLMPFQQKRNFKIFCQELSKFKFYNQTGKILKEEESIQQKKLTQRNKIKKRKQLQKMATFQIAQIIDKISNQSLHFLQPYKYFKLKTGFLVFDKLRNTANGETPNFGDVCNNHYKTVRCTHFKNDKFFQIDFIPNKGLMGSDELLIDRLESLNNASAMQFSQTIKSLNYSVHEMQAMQSSHINYSNEQFINDSNRYQHIIKQILADHQNHYVFAIQYQYNQNTQSYEQTHHLYNEKYIGLLCPNTKQFSEQYMMNGYKENISLVDFQDVYNALTQTSLISDIKCPIVSQQQKSNDFEAIKVSGELDFFKRKAMVLSDLVNNKQLDCNLYMQNVLKQDMKTVQKRGLKERPQSTSTLDVWQTHQKSQISTNASSTANMLQFGGTGTNFNSSTFTQRNNEIPQEKVVPLHHSRSITALSEQCFDRFVSRFQQNKNFQMQQQQLDKIQQKTPIKKKISRYEDDEQEEEEKEKQQQDSKTIQTKESLDKIQYSSPIGEVKEYQFTEENEVHYELFKENLQKLKSGTQMIQSKHSDFDIVKALFSPELAKQHENSIIKDLQNAKIDENRNLLQEIKNKVMSFDPYQHILPFDFPNEKRIMVHKLLQPQAAQTQKTQIKVQRWKGAICSSQHQIDDKPRADRLKIQEEMRNKTKSVLQQHINGNIELDIIKQENINLLIKNEQLQQKILTLELENKKIKQQEQLTREELFNSKSEIQMNLRQLNIVNQSTAMLRSDYEKLIIDSQNMKQFLSDFILIKARFPDQTIQQVIDRYDIIENKCVELVSSMAEIEENCLKKDKQACQLSSELGFKNQELENIRNILQKVKNSEKCIDELRQDQITKQLDYYKQQYLMLFNQLVELFLQWNTHAKLYYDPLVQRPLNANVNDPLELIKIMKEQVKISTNQSCQDYLRKIIVSVNLLQRKFFPDKVNSRFNPEKIYNRINKYISCMQGQLAQQKDETNQVKKQLVAAQKQILEGQLIKDSNQQNKQVSLPQAKQLSTEQSDQTKQSKHKRGTQANIDRLILDKKRRIGTTATILSQQQQQLNAQEKY